MIIKLLTDFFNQLSAYKPLPNYDKHFLDRFHKEFVTIDPSDHTQWILDIFAERWKIIADVNTVNMKDYTLDSGGINAPWVALSQDLETTFQKSYLQILIPTVSNEIDPNSFVKLADIRNPTSFYLGEDRATLYTLEGLRHNLKKNSPFCTNNPYHGDNHFSSRALTIDEILRIKSKRDSVPIEMNSVRYTNFIECLNKKIAPEWHKSGEIPKHILKSLLSIVNLYFTEKNVSPARRKFPNKLLLWTQKELSKCSIDSVHCLYGQKIKVNASSDFFMNVIQNCIQKDYEAIHDHVVEIARWLFECDHSYIAKHTALKDLYIELGAGPSFDVKKLLSMVFNLPKQTPLIRTKIGEWFNKYENKPLIHPIMIKELGDIFNLQWQNCLSLQQDYLRFPVGENTLPWIRVAQLLQSAGFIRNYYGFLMPTLKQLYDPITLLSITEYPLSSYILSENATMLYNLEICQKHYETHGEIFNNPYLSPPTLLTDLEIKRMSFAHQRFRPYIKNTHYYTDDFTSPISKRTVLAIYHLVNQSLFPNGLQYANEYTPHQDASAGKAYHIFYNYLKKIPEQELLNLYAQRIVFDDKIVSFKQVLVDVQRYNCIANAGQYFLQLALDYEPNLKFPELENQEAATLKKMRANSRNKIFSDYNFIDSKEAKRRILILASSLMSYNFQESYYHSEILSLYGCTNSIGPVIKKVYVLLKLWLKTEDLSQARYVYSRIMESAIISSLAKMDREWCISRENRPQHTRSWLESVKNESLFSKKDAWYFPGDLLTTLLYNKRDLPFALQQFVDEVIHTYKCSLNLLEKEIIVNIQFKKLLNTLPPSLQSHISTLLESPNPLTESIGKALTQMHQLTNSFNQHKGTFFSQPESKVDHFSECLQSLPPTIQSYFNGPWLKAIMPNNELHLRP